jgi:hypothetical protein
MKRTTQLVYIFTDKGIKDTFSREKNDELVFASSVLKSNGSCENSYKESVTGVRGSI